MEHRPHPLDNLAAARWALPTVWLLFCLPRLAILLLDTVPTSDAAWYFYRGADLAAGLGYISPTGKPTAFWPPGWPMVLGALFSVTGSSILAVGLFNFVCTILSGWLLMDIARKLTGSEITARLSLLLYAVYPNAIAYVPLALTEIFYTMLLLAGTRLLIARPRATRLIAAGLLFGFAMLVKAQTIVAIPLILAIPHFRRTVVWRTLPSGIGRGLLVVMLALLVVLPWTLRNHMVMEAWIPVSSNGGRTLLTGNHDEAAGDYTPDMAVVRQLEARNLGEVERDELAGEIAWTWIAENPGKFAALAPRKLWRLWGPDGEAEWAYQAGYARYADHASLFRAIRIINQLYYAALLLAFICFALWQLRRRLRLEKRLIDWWLLPYALALYPTAIAVIFSGQSRFHFPVMPFVILTAAWLLARGKQRRHVQENIEPCTGLAR